MLMTNMPSFLITTGGIFLLSIYFNFIIAAGPIPICKACIKGTYSNQSNYNCSSCDNPGYCIIMSYCIPCQPGTFGGHVGSRECLPCEKGYVTSESKSISCTACTPGTYQNNKGQTHCLPCEPGTNCSTNACMACSPCKEGTFANGTNNSQCTPCAPGFMNNMTGNTRCSPCGMGKFAQANGMANCESCRPGTFGNQTGLAKCFDCPPGKYSDKQGSTECKVCAPGYYSEFNGQSICFPCQKGSYCLYDGCQTCTLCPPGMDLPFLNSSTNECKSCTPGTYAPTFGTATCRECDFGYIAEDNNATQCTLCPRSYYCPTPKEKRPCPPTSVCPPGTVEPMQCHGPVWEIEPDTETCILSSEFIGVILGSIGSVIFIVAVFAFLIWRQISQGQVHRAPILIPSAENTPLVSRRNTANVMYTGL